ncbi:MAG TPA: fimbria/pilus periplasmic chaperone [Gammaproteobacteria bacterium]|jgi:fimbrial chaperone protein
MAGTPAARPVIPLSLAVLPVLLACLLSAPVTAGSFRISPTLADVPPGASMATFRVQNSGGTPLTLQVTAKKWGQHNGEDILVSTGSLLVVPPISTIAPGASQVVRVALQQPRPKRELAYRVFFHEVPPPPAPGTIGVQTALRLSIPLFFAPEKTAEELDWKVQRAANGKLRLTAHNRGTRFARLTGLGLTAGRHALTQLDGPLYILAGTRRHWLLPEPPAKTRRLTLSLEAGHEKEQRVLMLK